VRLSFVIRKDFRTALRSKNCGYAGEREGVAMALWYWFISKIAWYLVFLLLRGSEKYGKFAELMDKFDFRSGVCSFHAG